MQIEKGYIFYSEAPGIKRVCNSLNTLRPVVRDRKVRSVSLDREYEYTVVQFSFEDGSEAVLLSRSSYQVVCVAIQKWRNLYGAKLFVYGNYEGIVEAENVYLKRIVHRERALKPRTRYKVDGTGQMPGGIPGRDWPKVRD